MDILLDVLGYGIIGFALIGVLYIFGKILITSLDTLTKNDD